MPTLASPSPAPTILEETPSRQALLDQLPPHATQSEVSLDPVTLGTALKAELPPFDDPGGKGLALHAAAPPAGVTLHDLGGGRSALEGTPSAVGHSEFDVVAVNHNGKSARMKVTLDVAGAPPQPAQSAIELEPATVGALYSAGLPPFRAKEALTLRADHLPLGLSFADLGGGLSQLAGKPTKAGRYAFDVVAKTASGTEGRMAVSIAVDPAPSATPTPTVAATATPSPSPSVTTVSLPAQITAFLAAPAADPCFLVRFEDDDPSGGRLVAVGADRDAFGRFEADYRRAFQRDPEVRAELITPAQCPVVSLLKLQAASAATAPRVTLDRVAVGKGRPLSGAITELASRPLLLLAIGDDGRAVKVRAQLSDDGQSAALNLGMTGDADSFGKPQILLAVASDRPLADMDKFRAGASADLARKLAAQWREAGAAATLALFKLEE